MNYRLVLKTYTALRQLTDEETALLETLRNMTDAERELTVETLSPQVKSTKKAGKKAAGKSRRASGMAEAIRNSVERGRVASNDNALCDYVFTGGGSCKRSADHNIHHLQTDSLYHEFTAAKDDSYETQAAAGD